MAAPFVTLRNPRTGRPIRAGSRLVRNHGGNVAAPAIVANERFSVAPLLEWPGTNNQLDNILLQRDWSAMLNGPQSRYSFVRVQPTWHLINAGAYNHWQPAFNRVNRIWRKGASGGLQRILVFTMDVNTNQIRAGDTCWFYHLLEEGTYEGGVSKAANLELYPGFLLRLRGNGGRYLITACRPSPPGSGYEGATSEVEVTFNFDLPPIDFAPQRWNPHAWWPGHTESKLIFVHHSFYADASTKRLRTPIGSYADVIRNQVLRYGGSAVVGGLQRIPTYQCWTTLANQLDAHSLVFDLYRLEQEGLAETFGDLPTDKLANELENEAVAPWTDTEARADTSLPNPQNAIGLRTSLANHMIPISRAAWGSNRTLIVKGTGFGGLDGLRSFDLNMQAMWPGIRALLGNHNYGGSYSPHISDGGRQLWYGSRADADAHAIQLVAKAIENGFDGAIMTEWGASSELPAAERGRQIGMVHTAMAAKGIPVCYWDLVGNLTSEPFHFARLYTDVPGSAPANVQAVLPELRPYCGRAGRTTA